jgi:hypothetical protein
MTKDQFNKLVTYIGAAIENHHDNDYDGLSARANRRTLQELHDSFFPNNEEEDLLQLKIIQVLDQKKIIEKHLLFFDRLLNPSDLGWSVTEEVRNEAREFLGIPRVIIKKK